MVMAGRPIFIGQLSGCGALIGKIHEEERAMGARNGPLAGMRVLELAQIMAGPTAGMMLADLGADVIKVEKLPGGDDTRSYREPRVNGHSAPFLAMNHNKRGI